MPVFVPGCAYDLFVSYAHVDNELLFQAKTGWVTRLVQNLQGLLAQKLGRRETFQVWWDRRNLRGHQATDGIVEEVAKSALLLLILSPGYLESDDCRRELDAFRKAHGARAKGRIFVAEVEKPDADTPVPSDVSTLLRYRFWQLDEVGKPRALGLVPTAEPEPAYCRQVVDLASDLAARMKQLRNDAGYPLPTMPLPAQPIRQDPRPAVLLADTTDDLLDAQDELRRFLDVARQLRLPVPAIRIAGLAARDGF